ncbi:NACHT, LRR and PYD domains-containing protein 12-like [Chanos chanos]|uniref:NACHT, LRR and PYD domains-containing protein 12-like n=1 Tax=Chanos chanos TaxID=29144 RepID=A0A6J2USU8_CHACN|nr:NACHT, LRR and PYD domains-containing protein 12-like [Chanos chanos]
MSLFPGGKERGIKCKRHLTEGCDGGTDSKRRNTGFHRHEQLRSVSPTPSCVSLKSDASKHEPPDLSEETSTSHRSKLTVSELTEDLPQCDMCKEKLRDLVSIPCGHRYCRQCICKWDLSELVQVQQAEFSPVNTEHCYSGPGDVACDFCTGMKLRAVKSCLTCPASLCEIHVRQHYTIPALQRHTLVEVTGDLEQRLCQQHHRVLEVFCKTDQTHICKVCAGEEHKGHSKYYREISIVPDIKNLLMVTLRSVNKEKIESFKRELSEDYPGCFGTELEDLDLSTIVMKMLESFGEEGTYRITQHFLTVVIPLRAATEANKTKLIQKFLRITEGISPQGKPSLLNEIYTELYITEGGSGEVNNEHEVRQIEMTAKTQDTQETPIKLNDIFKTLPGQRKQIRTVLTKGTAGIGKTVSVQMFILDWAEGKANQDITVIVPLPFRDLNLKRENYSLIQLLHHYAPELKEIKYIEDKTVKLLLIFDGLDECRFPLDFQNNELCCDVMQTASMEVLLINLIKGNLLPSALLWITSRPAAANQIPPECVHQVTEVRGFRDTQKEEYFRKKISDPNLANRVIKHTKSSRSLYIMCHIPVFCWLSATVLEYMMRSAGTSEIPKTLTEMYTHFLLLQISLKNKKYHGAIVRNPKKLSESDKEMILKLGKLAFQQLEKGNLIFYEEDLRECGIDISKASEYSSVCTEIFREELGLYRDKVFCFVHLSIQEHLAAVYAHVSCADSNLNVFNMSKARNEERKWQLHELHQHAVYRALQSKNGHLDLFLRFLVSLSLDSNQTLLQDLMTGTCSEFKKHTVRETIQNIKMKISEESSPERIVNLFHCLNELNDNSLVEEIQTAFRSGTLSDKELEPNQCSALAYMLLMSEEVLDEFDLRMYKTSAAGQERLLPVLRTCKKARLNYCDLPLGSCETIVSALQFEKSPLRELDLSYSNLTDSGVKQLCAGLMSPNCKLQRLGLSWCGLTNGCCEDLALFLRSLHANLRELELRDNDLQDSGVKLLSAGLKHPNCNLTTLGLSGCLITKKGCASLASALRSNPSHLKELDLSYNHPGDSGMKLLSALLEDPLYELEKLELASCGLSSETCVIMASALQTSNSLLRELDLSYNNLKDSGVKLLCDGLMSPHCKLHKLILSECSLTGDCCVDLASVLKSPHCNLTKLELSFNNLQDSGVKELSTGLEDLHCKLHTLGLSGCNLSFESCVSMASVLQSVNSPLRDLDLSNNNSTDLGLKVLCTGLMSANCKLQKLSLNVCSLTKRSCTRLALVLKSPHSNLRELNLRDNDLQDSGVKLLSAGLKDPHCKLQKLGLSGCQITKKGCSSLTSALRSNPKHLIELDLRYNHTGNSKEMLSALLGDPSCKLEKLELDHDGEWEDTWDREI